MHPSDTEKDGTILIIDSDPQDLVFAKRVLMTDFEILIAPSVEAAERLSPPPRPDLLLLALDAVDSSDVSRARSICAEAVFLGPDSLEDELRAYQLGGIGYIRMVHDAELLRHQVYALYRLVASVSILKKSLRRETRLRQSIDVFSYSFQDKRILLAEDVHINQLILSNILFENKVTVDTADDGAMALAMFTAAPDAYAAILMDIQMPVMDGIAATRAIRALGTEQSRRIPIIALTASLTPDDMRNFKRLGMDAALEKPVNPERLLRTLIELVVQ